MPEPTEIDATVTSTGDPPTPEHNDATAQLTSAPRVSELVVGAVRAARDLPVVARAMYDILGEHSRGGLGRILRARDTRTGRVVAIKEMLASNDAAARRFAREALITANLQHPAIVPVYELGRWESGEPFYAMKLVAGRSFEDVLKTCTTLDARLARLPIVLSVAEALAYAHARRVIHRDLKPANVLVGDLGETVVIDWGLAKSLGADGDDDAEPLLVPDLAEPVHTVVGRVMGTPLYMPPEQARGDATDERADVYQIGALLYHLICGSAPYAGRGLRGSREIVTAVKTEAPVPLREREGGAPSDLITIVDKAMAREPADRYASAGELAAELRRFTAGQLVMSHHYDRRTLVARWLARNRAPVTVAGVLVLVLAGVAAWSVRSILAERDNVQEQRDIALREAGRAEDGLATALYQKGRGAESKQEWARAAMYFAAARRHHDSQERAWAAGLAEARAVVPVARHTGHAAWVHAASVSPDGARVATVDDAGELRVWAPEDGHLVAARRLSKKALYAVAFAPDGSLAVAGDEGVIHRLGPDLRDLPELRGHVGRVWTLVYSADGAMLASGGDDKTVRLWTSSGSRTLEGHEQRVYSVAFAPDGKHLASGSDDRHVRVWDLATGASQDRGDHKAGGIRVVAYTASGDAIITTGWDHEIRVWKGDLPPEVWQEPDVVHGAAIVPGLAQQILVTGGEIGAIHAWDVSTHELITSLDAPGGQTSAVAFSRDGRWLITAGKAAPVAWDASAFRRAAVGHRTEVTGLAFTDDGKRLASGATDHTLRVWDVATGVELRRVSTGFASCSDGVLALGDDLVSACSDKTLRRWDAADRERRIDVDGWLRVTSLSPDRTTLAAGHESGRLALVDLASWKVVVEKPLHDHNIYGVAYAADGRIVTASLDDHVRVWRVTDFAKDLDVTVGTDDGILAAALSPDGKLLAIGTQDGSLDVWDVAAAKWRVRDAGAARLGTVWRLAYGPDGAHVFTASDDGIARIWDTTTWTPAPLDAGEGAAISLALSHDGATLAVGYRSGAIAIFDVATRRLRTRIGGRTRERGSCADVATQAFTDVRHRAIVAAACATPAQTYFDQLSERTRQRLDGEIDVTWNWLGAAR